ncbi:MAG: hypothetical protein ABS68_09210 [Niastella sp. SCN 39-18]|nr:hypothetical protein [Sphingobacteriales bacterium]ODT52279.1 MAG: hypothetical protein ABS68_09210 [Niastella sp. SCN 39-18]OJW10443.1 MAG: hypothetical protein BGO53_09685 [Sphingobacteriales bacterium 39-19]
MAEIYHPVLSSRKIIRAVIIALFLGALLVFCAILPAEYGIDPTGVGKALGFTRLHASSSEAGASTVRMSYPRLKMEKAGSDPSVKKPIEADNPPPTQQYDVREDSVQVTVPAGKGIEYKVYMLKHGQMKYEWSTEKDVLYIDFHGEVNEAEPAKDTYYESYTLAYADNMVGTFLSPFEGKHGWFFRNNGQNDVVVTIRLKGQYSL